MFLIISSVQLLSRVWLFVTPWIAARQASLSITNSWSSLRLTSIELVMPSSHLILCRPLLLLPPIPPSIRVFSNESTLCMRWTAEGPLEEVGTHEGCSVAKKKRHIWQIGPSTSGRWSRLTSREKNHVDRIFLRYDVMRMTFYVYGFIPPNRKLQDFPGGSVVKNLPAKVGDTDSIPGPGGFYMLRMQLSSWATTPGPVL